MRNSLKVCGLLAGVCSALALVGCGGKPKPDGMPELIPAIVVVTQNGAPLGDAALTLTSADGSCKWAVGGRTDAQGRATLYTQGDYKGAPEGTFKVGVSKFEIKVKEGAVDEEGNPFQPSPEQAKNPKLLDARFAESKSLVPSDCENAQTSPLEVTIAKGAKEVTLDVPALEE